VIPNSFSWYGAEGKTLATDARRCHSVVTLDDNSSFAEPPGCDDLNGSNSARRFGHSVMRPVRHVTYLFGLLFGVFKRDLQPPVELMIPISIQNPETFFMKSR
jgi:hypothetical protein